MKRIVLLAALLAAACDQPPVKEMAAAEEQVAHARAAGADRYAPERLKDAEAALVVAHDRLRERDYRAALSAVNDAAESARLAVAAVAPAKAAARKQAEVAIVEVRTMLDRASEERTAALKAGVPRTSLVALDARGQRAAQQLAEVSNMRDAGNPDFIATLLATLRTDVTPLPDMFRDARTQWETKHKPRRR
jgi:hypothetical protein